MIVAPAAGVQTGLLVGPALRLEFRAPLPRFRVMLVTKSRAAAERPGHAKNLSVMTVVLRVIRVGPETLGMSDHAAKGPESREKGRAAMIVRDTAPLAATKAFPETKNRVRFLRQIFRTATARARARLTISAMAISLALINVEVVDPRVREDPTILMNVRDAAARATLAMKGRDIQKAR